MKQTNSPSLTILLYGPRGCGKSLSAGAFFGEMQKSDPVWTTVSIVAAQILEDPFSELKSAFRNIEQYGINGILVEDIDILFVELRKYASARIFLLDKLKHPGERQLLIATARKPEALAPEELEAFQDVLPILYPDEAGRREILQVHSTKANINLDIGSIARQTEWWSGEEIELLVDKLATATPNPSTTLIDHAINQIGERVNSAPRIQRTKELVDFTQQYCTNSQMRNDVISRYSASAGLTNQRQIQDPYLRSEVERALTNMNLENVDLALFQLAKLFENELKSYLQVAQSNGIIKIGSREMGKLSSMINIVAQNGIVKKSYHLEILREERNERAHGKVPDKAERVRLLEHGPFLRDLYIQYIVFFNEEKLKLESSH